MKKMLILAVTFLFCLTAVTGCAGPGSKTAEKTEPVKADTPLPPADPNKKNSLAVFETSMGTFKVELFEDKAPRTAQNFISLVNKGFYNGLIFHRVIDGFMIQGGDPKGNGTGGPGYVIPDEFHKDLKHTGAGILSMANAGPNSGGSQFFITLDATPWLDGKHAIFGKVVEGLDVVKAIGKVKTGAQDRPQTDVVMKKITIVTP
ncbi:MAG: peptidylprolyl isomerase [Anaeromusa sp.]|jgi:cyclophilin family peptidyl-prolyl cis-trans isomerase|uniref:peptidylprolyl isomerase n=1 Tax=Anaeromusa sp. TaxID=1872520 RepID=UPI0026255ED2|nr:peptidylprolyl isomerase [Anaeromusa sp.]MDD3158511.1 peptidylprolyl isomerase [Anaeromusa sp.]MEA4836294.1 peptidylprolyl isomerase [Anaeromusa sp.]